MALQVWLPLIDNFENYGVSDLKFSRADGSGYPKQYTREGSLSLVGRLSGKSTFFNGNNTDTFAGGGLISDKKINLGKHLTMACWVCPHTLCQDSALAGGIGGQHRYTHSTGMGLTLKYVSDAVCQLSCNTGGGGGDGNRTFNAYCADKVFDRSQINSMMGMYGYWDWQHVCMTYDGTTIRFYINGEPAGEHVYTDQVNVEDYIHVYAWSNYNDSLYPFYKLWGMIQDFRVYDHTLSPKEVKEIGKGLIAHYPMKVPRINNMTKGYPLTIYNNYSVGATLVQLDETFMGEPVYRLTMTPTSDALSDFQTNLWSHGVYHGQWTFNASTKYCYWIYYRPVSHGDIRVGGTASNINGWTEIAPQHYCGEWYRVGQCRTGGITWNETDNIFTSFRTPSAAVGQPIVVDFCAPRLIVGTDSPVEDFGGEVSANVMRDVSGYNNHLTVAGTLAPRGDSPRYDQSVNFNQTGYLYYNDLYCAANQWTIAFWINPPYNINGQHFICGTFDDWTGNGFGMWRDSSGGGYSMIYRVNGFSSWTDLGNLVVPHDSWNHVAIVFDKICGIVYLNGQEVKRVTHDNGAVWHKNIYLGNSMYIGTPSSETDEASLSDFRFYVNALTAEDVKGLYQAGASVGNSGAILAHEFSEIAPEYKSVIGKNGVVSATGFSDCSTPMYDMKLKVLDDGSAWARIYHLDVSHDATYFANEAEVNKCVNKNNRYSRMGDVDKFKSRPSLPKGYTELEYIESSGTQYIDTGVVYSSAKNFRTKMKFSYATTAPANQIHGFTGNRGMGIGTSGATWWECSTPASVTAGTLYEIEWTIKSNGEYNRIINGNHNAGSGGGGHSSYSGHMYLFAAHESATASGFVPSYMCQSKLYYTQIYENDVMVRNFVPCRNSSGTVGLYDLIEKKFYGNAGSGTFTAGEFVSKYEFMLTYPALSDIPDFPTLPSEYTQLDYIESTGTQYIDTGFVPNQDTRVDVQFSTPTVADGGVFVYGSGVDSGTSAFELYPWSGALQFNYGSGEQKFVGAVVANQIITASQNKNLVTWSYENVRYETSHPGRTFTTPYTLTLFALHRASILVSPSMKLYSCQIYNNGSLVRDFVPCINPSGSVGLYDLVGQAFYANAGTGSFAAGNFKYNRWTQLSSPNEASVSGYTPIYISWPDHSFGIRRHGSACIYNCDSGGTWYAPIGQLGHENWNGAGSMIPAANGANTSRTELWVRIDKAEKANRFQIHDGSIVATDFVEI